MTTREDGTSPEDIAKVANLDPAMADVLTAREAARRRDIAAPTEAEAEGDDATGDVATDRSAMRVDSNTRMPSIPDAAEDDTTGASVGGSLLAGAVLPEADGDDARATLPPPADLGISAGAAFLDRDLDIRLPSAGDGDADDDGSGLDVDLPGVLPPGRTIDVGGDLDLDIVPVSPPATDTGGSEPETDEDATDIGADLPEETAGSDTGAGSGETDGEPIAPGDSNGTDTNGTDTNGTTPQDEGPGQGHAYGRDRDDDQHGRGQGQGRGHDEDSLD